MKKIFRKLCAPLLNVFEAGTEQFVYKPSQRKILLVVAVLFLGLASLVFVLAQGEDPGYLFPVLIFGVIGFISLIIGLIGTDRAVAKIWGSTS